MRLYGVLMVLCGLGGLAGCGDDSTGTDSGVDAGSQFDAGSRFDAGSGSDAGTDAGVDGGSDLDASEDSAVDGSFDDAALDADTDAAADAGGSVDAGCPAGQMSCGGSCVDLQTSVVHCGACDNACDSGFLCVEGGCVNPSVVGCSDGQREGMTDTTAFPDIAACDGAFDQPGVTARSTFAPACERGSGDDSENVTGTGCNVTDLCAEGWNVCVGPTDAMAAGVNCTDAIDGRNDLFYTTRQSGPGSFICGAGVNDLFGCGSSDVGANAPSCGTLNRLVGGGAGPLPTNWDIGGSSTEEANTVTKTGSAGGGVLCCRTPPG